MATASDSTRAPSRRAFLSSAVAAGAAAAQPPIFTVAAVADAAVLAMGPVLTGLAAAVDAVLGEADDEAFADVDMHLLAGQRALAEMPATTLEGLILKARWVRRGDVAELKESIVEDLIAMG